MVDSATMAIVAAEDDTRLGVRDVPGFLRHLLERVDWRRDLHFQTRTTIDTLDYSGPALHEGSKVVIAACGPPAAFWVDSDSGGRADARLVSTSLQDKKN